jgi:hypothetical protein
MFWISEHFHFCLLLQVIGYIIYNLILIQCTWNGSVIEKNACIFRRFYNFLHIYFVVVNMSSTEKNSEKCSKGEF